MAKQQISNALVAKARSMKEDGWSWSQLSNELGIKESTLIYHLRPGRKAQQSNYMRNNYIKRNETT